jgi:hypothetical protein
MDKQATAAQHEAYICIYKISEVLGCFMSVVEENTVALRCYAGIGRLN